MRGHGAYCYCDRCCVIISAREKVYKDNMAKGKRYGESDDEFLNRVRREQKRAESDKK